MIFFRKNRDFVPYRFFLSVSIECFSWFYLLVFNTKKKKTPALCCLCGELYKFILFYFFFVFRFLFWVYYVLFVLSCSFSNSPRSFTLAAAAAAEFFFLLSLYGCMYVFELYVGCSGTGLFTHIENIQHMFFLLAMVLLICWCLFDSSSSFLLLFLLFVRNFFRCRNAIWKKKFNVYISAVRRRREEKKRELSKSQHIPFVSLYVCFVRHAFVMWLTVSRHTHTFFLLSFDTSLLNTNIHHNSTGS